MRGHVRCFFTADKMKSRSVWVEPFLFLPVFGLRHASARQHRFCRFRRLKASDFTVKDREGHSVPKYSIWREISRRLRFIFSCWGVGFDSSVDSTFAMNGP